MGVHGVMPWMGRRTWTVAGQGLTVVQKTWPKLAASNRVVTTSVDRLMCDDEESCVDDMQGAVERPVAPTSAGCERFVGTCNRDAPKGKGPPLF